jgi:hypothetical protein
MESRLAFLCKLNPSKGLRKGQSYWSVFLKVGIRLIWWSSRIGLDSNSRTSAGKYQLDVTELRTAFSRSEVLGEKIDRFWLRRVANIVAGEAPVSIGSNPKLILHLLPTISFSSNFQLDLSNVPQYEGDLFTPIGAYHGHSGRFNVDGYLTYSGSSLPGLFESYLQLFRSGIIETVNSHFLRPEPLNRPGVKGILPLTPIEDRLLKAIYRGLSLFKHLDLLPPIDIRFSLFGIKDYQLIDPDRRFPYSNSDNVLERDEIIFRGILIEDFDVDLNVLLRPSFDALWQAGGWRRSQNFDENGNRKSLYGV